MEKKQASFRVVSLEKDTYWDCSTRRMVVRGEATPKRARYSAIMAFL